MLFVTALIPLLLVIDQYRIVDISSYIVGVILLVVFLVNTYLMSRKRTPAVGLNNGQSLSKKKKIFVTVTLLLSVALIVVAARLTVYSASNIAVALGVPPVLVGAKKIVSIGTSLPELTLELTAVKRGRVPLALGGIIGSNPTNLTLVLGLVLLTSPFQVDMTMFIEILPFLLITTIIFWRSIMRNGISKIEGVVLMLIYLLFQVLVM